MRCVALDLDDSPVGLMLTDTMAVGGKTADSTVAAAAGLGCGRWRWGDGDETPHRSGE
jgi:hypothetical protein